MLEQKAPDDSFDCARIPERAVGERIPLYQNNELHLCLASNGPKFSEAYRSLSGLYLSKAYVRKVLLETAVQSLANRSRTFKQRC